MDLRDTPGLPDPHLYPPVVAEPDDPFAALRVVHLVARLPRGQAVRVRDIVDRLEHEHMDWSFSGPVVVAAIVQLQANWLVDYRNSDGIVLRDGQTGPELVIEDDPESELLEPPCDEPFGPPVFTPHAPAHTIWASGRLQFSQRTRLVTLE